MLKKDLLEILCCPKCHGDLLYETTEGPAQGTLTCKVCGKVYQVKDDIPILLVEDESDTSI